MTLCDICLREQKYEPAKWRLHQQGVPPLRIDACAAHKDWLKERRNRPTMSLYTELYGG